MKPLFWSFVYTRDSKPLAAFCDRALAEAYVMKEPEQGETIINRSLSIGGESPLVIELDRTRQLLRDIVNNDNTVAGDTKMIRAIGEAKRLLKISS